MRYKNKKTNEIIDAKGYVQEFACSHNSEWEKVNVEPELTVVQIKEILDKKGIEYDNKAKKDKLLALIPQE